MTRTYDYIPIVGPGVDAYERRRECGGGPPISTAELRDSIEKVKGSIFNSLKMLLTEAR